MICHEIASQKLELLGYFSETLDSCKRSEQMSNIYFIGGFGNYALFWLLSPLPVVGLKRFLRIARWCNGPTKVVKSYQCFVRTDSEDGRFTIIIVM